MIDDLPPLREVIAAHGLAARKALGQNFILDLNLTAKIARLAGARGQTVLEIGPGPGGLTRGLLAEGAARVVAVEKDPRCLPALEEIASRHPGRLDIVVGDALASDLGSLAGDGARIVSNLPYNVGTELLTRWLDPPDWPPFWTSMTLMFQREVAERLVAEPGSGAYGRLSILAQWRTEPRIVLDLPPAAFVPAPKVRSAVVRLDRLPEPRYPADAATLFRLVAAAFGQRRKMLRAALRGVAPDIEARLAEAGIESSQRAETVPLAAYCALAQTFDP